MRAKPLRDAVFIIVSASAIAILLNTVHPRGFDLVKKTAPGFDLMVSISPAEARIKHVRGDAVFLDARDEAEFRASKIAGARNVPATLVRLPNFNSSGRDLVIYCGEESCGASELLAGRIIEAGYRRHIYIIKGGLPAWESAGYPVKRAKAAGGGPR